MRKMEAIITSSRASLNFKTVVVLLVSLFMLGSVMPTMGLRCYRCGQYTDGVGSITPCINYTSHNLQDCPEEQNIYCIKFVSEGSVVRECIDKCVEKETWGTKKDSDNDGLLFASDFRDLGDKERFR
ncbi:uncharacterized protein LOC111867128 isoform X2 [Cryptotermes secundus]|uniref:uncharacterized protein LOC111867128 isoform X2 n=1 Tax=Cryptotermes secundus TaxID=105785 RepID=UPI000CD7CE2E|nr:uncharacterized protein LOC111867128 isoform X2 [Cryptotermes secundus]